MTMLRVAAIAGLIISLNGCASSPSASPTVRPIVSEYLNSSIDGTKDFSLTDCQYAVINYQPDPSSSPSGAAIIQFYYGPGQTVHYRRQISLAGSFISYVRNGGVVFESR